MTRYKLRKDLPLAPAGTEVNLHETGGDYFDITITDPFSEQFCCKINRQDIPIWLVEIKENKRWRAEKGGEYWCVNSRGDVEYELEYDDDIDNFRYSTYNYFQNEKQAQEYLDYITALATVNNKIDELNDGWEHNHEGIRHSIYYVNDEYGVDFFNAKGYIRPFVIKYTKTREIAEQIISDYKKELDIIFNYK